MSHEQDKANAEAKKQQQQNEKNAKSNQKHQAEIDKQNADAAKANADKEAEAAKQKQAQSGASRARYVSELVHFYVEIKDDHLSWQNRHLSFFTKKCKLKPLVAGATIGLKPSSGQPCGQSSMWRE